MKTEMEYRMFWSLYGVLCGPIHISAKNDKDARELAKRVVDFQKSIFPQGEPKAVSLKRLDVHEKTTEIELP